MKFYSNIKKILTKDEILFFLLISFGLVIASIIELFGISLIIPIIYTLVSEDFYSKIIIFLENYGISDFTKDSFIHIFNVFFYLYYKKYFVSNFTGMRESSLFGFRKYFI